MREQVDNDPDNDERFSPKLLLRNMVIAVIVAVYIFLFMVTLFNI
jgi:hypothetical protein